MVIGDGSLAAAARDDRDREPFGKLTQCVVRARLVDAGAGQDHRAAGGGQRAHHGLGVVHRWRGPRQRQTDRLAVIRRRLVVRHLLLEDVSRNAQVHRTWRPAEGTPDRFADQARNVLPIRCLGAPLGDRREQRDLVDLLVLLPEALGAPHGGDEGDDRRGGPERLGQCAGHVRRAGPVGPVGERRASGDAGEGVGHVHGSPLAARQDLADADFLERDPQRVVASGHEEEMVAASSAQLVSDGASDIGDDKATGRRRPGGVSDGIDDRPPWVDVR